MRLDLYSAATPENVLLLYEKAVMIHKPGKHEAYIVGYTKYKTKASATASVANWIKQIIPRDWSHIFCEMVNKVNQTKDKRRV